MSTHTRLKGISHIGDSLLNEQIDENLVSFFDWGLLEVGNFYNVTAPISGVYGGNQNRLRLCDEPNYTKGQVWEAFKSNWVWESGLEYSTQPIAISGIHVNNTFYPTGTSGAYAYDVNYPQGRIVFQSAIPITSQVKVDYSYKYINVYSANTDWFKELMPQSFRVDSPQFDMYGSGIWSTLSQSRIQLPALIIEVVPRRTFEPYQLGGGQYVIQDVLFHAFAENTFDRNLISDITTYQSDKTIYLYDKNAVVRSGMKPINYDGTLSSNPKTYPDIVEQFQWRHARFENIRSEDSQSISPSLFMAVSRATIRIECPEL